MVMPVSNVIPRFDSEDAKNTYLANLEAMLYRHSQAAAQWQALGHPTTADAHRVIFHDVANLHDKVTGGDIRTLLFGGQ